MATQTLPPTVAADDEIVTAWGNQVVTNLTHILGAIVAGDLLVGDDPRSLARLSRPSGRTGTMVLKIDLATGTVSWSTDTGSSAFDPVGRAIVDIDTPSVDGDYYVRVNKSGNTVTAVALSPAQLFAALIPSGTSRPSGLDAGRLWIDTDA